ncbi:hypothetical protein [Paenibacillus sp. IHBB 10380]|uniref:hypothetical protein n=1 Tax=Paenibacillus sp. IHBB 10380 TaxID=1566358 RepID=UPI0005CF9B00|nr:hypothetical protein [Paenibacillus sp. IHBB 10380]AJS58361.1 hypothetical protein UB51_07450 [Paenibacillus sp. IHBB 10380]
MSGKKDWDYRFDIKEEGDDEPCNCSGLDVSEGANHAQAFLEKNKPYGKTFGLLIQLKGC